MLKKLLTLSLVAVMLSTAAFATSMVAEPVYAAEEVTEVTVTSPEMILVTTGSENYTISKLTSAQKMLQNSSWVYVRYDISKLQTLEEIKSVALDIGIRFEKTGTVELRPITKNVWDAAANAMGEESTGTVAAATAKETFVDPATMTVGKLGTINRESGGNGKTYTYTLTGYGYEYKNDKTISTGFDAWRPVTISAGNLLDYVKEAWTDKEQYLYFAASYAYKSGSSYFVYYQPQSAYNSLKASSDVMVIYNTNNVAYKGSTFYPNYIVYQWPSSLTIPTNITTDFTYSVLVAPAGTKVRLLCAIYGENSELLGVESSNVLTVGTDKTSLKVPLTTKYATATNVKCFLWDGETLRPYTSDFLEKTVEIPAAE